jgi:hypothetical protein
MPDETTIPKAGNTIEDPRREVAKRPAQAVADRVLQKAFENLAMPADERRRVPYTVPVAQLAITADAGPAQLIESALPMSDPVERAVDCPAAGARPLGCSILSRLHSTGTAQRLSTGGATRSLLIWLSTTAPSG